MLSLKNHHWAASDESAQFCDANNSLTFLSKWEEIYHTVSTLVLDDSPAVPSPAVLSPTSSQTEDRPPPPKKTKYDINDDLIENHKIGK